MSKGNGWEAAAPLVGQSNLFGQSVIFFGQQAAAKNENKIILLYLLNKKVELIPSNEMKCPKSGITNYRVG